VLLLLHLLLLLHPRLHHCGVELLLLHLLLMLHPLRGGDRCSVGRSHLLVRRGLPSAGGPTTASR